MKKPNINPNILNAALCCAMLALLVTAFLPIVGIGWSGLKIIFAVAAAVTLVCQVLIPSPAGDLRTRRLARMNVWASVLYCVAAACPFINDEAMQSSWVAFLLAGAVLQIYATLMLSHVSKQQQ